MERSSVEVFENIQAMMSKVLLWNSITFIDWQDDKQINSAKDFVTVCLDFIARNSQKFIENSFFSDEETSAIYEKYEELENVVSSYYASMDKQNLMKTNQQAFAILSLFREIPVKKETVIDGCPF